MLQVIECFSAVPPRAMNPSDTEAIYYEAKISRTATEFSCNLLGHKSIFQDNDFVWFATRG